jgi:hypothetical protein
LKGLIEALGDQLPVFTSLVLLERRPVLFVGYVESRVLREVRFLTPHRDVYELGRNIPTNPKDADQFILDMLRQEDVLSSQPPPRRTLVLAPNAEGGIIETLLHFRKAWVGNCMTLPRQDRVQTSNVAIYDINANKWLNVDTTGIDTTWSAALIREAVNKKGDELIQAFLNYVITSISTKATALCSYISAGISNPSDVWRDVGEPSGEEREVISSLCKAEFNIDASMVLKAMNNPPRAEAKHLNGTHETEDENRFGRAEKLAAMMAAEERRIRGCLEAVRSRLK